MMKFQTFFLALGLDAVLALTAAGCGGSAPAGGGGGAPAASGPAWEGAGAWNNLSKQTNYSFQTTVNIGGQTMTLKEEQHDPGNYEMSMNEGGQTETFIEAGGHFYMGTGSGFMDLGTSHSSSGSSGLRSAASTWQSFLNGGNATYAGPCSADGQIGNSYNFKVSSGLLGAAVTGANVASSGSACVDAASGVLLSSNVKWSYAAGGKTVSYADTFQLTGLGNIPPIPAPAGAVALPTGGQGQ